MSARAALHAAAGAPAARAARSDRPAVLLRRPCSPADRQDHLLPLPRSVSHCGGALRRSPHLLRGGSGRGGRRRARDRDGARRPAHRRGEPPSRRAPAAGPRPRDCRRVPPARAPHPLVQAVSAAGGALPRRDRRPLRQPPDLGPPPAPHRLRRPAWKVPPVRGPGRPARRARLQVGRSAPRSGLGTSSPFNIKVESLTLPNFTADEVAELYGQHTADTGQLFALEAKTSPSS